LANIRHDIDKLKLDLKGGYSKALSEVLRDQETEEEKVAAQLQEQLVNSAKPAEREWEKLPGLVDLIYSADDPDSVRLKLRQVLRRVIAETHVLIVRRASYRLVAAQFFFIGGQHRSYLIVHQTAGNLRPGGAWAGSFAKLTEKDFRRPADVKQVEQVLQRVEIGPLTKSLLQLSTVKLEYQASGRAE
jgi:hypothetical protein